jgi:hypothetical protein
LADTGKTENVSNISADTEVLIHWQPKHRMFLVKVI